MSALRASNVARLMKSRGLRSLPESEQSLAVAGRVFLGDRLDELSARSDEPVIGDAETDRERKIRFLLANS